MKTKKLLLCISLSMALVTVSMGQLRIYNSDLLKIGNVNETPSLTTGFEASMPNLLFRSGNTGISINSSDLLIGALNQKASLPSSIRLETNGISWGISNAGMKITKEENVYYIPKGLTDPPGEGSSINKGVVTRMEGYGLPMMIGSGSNQLVGVYSTRYYSSSATGISSLSDLRRKTNIRPMESSLEKIRSMNPVRFDYVQDDKLPEKIADSTRSNKVGFIAQELMEIIPEAVDYDTYEDAFMVDYSVIIPFLVKAVQEQQAEIDRLKALLEKE